MAKSFVCYDIPDNSIFRIKVSAADGGGATRLSFVAQARFHHPSGETVTWSDRELRTGRNQRLSARCSYECRLLLLFTAKSTARISMRVDYPDGSTAHVYEKTVSRDAGTADSTKVSLDMHKHKRKKRDKDSGRRGSSRPSRGGRPGTRRTNLDKRGEATEGN